MQEIPLSAVPPTPPAQQLSFYDEVGGHDTFVALVDRFYEGVATDDVLLPLYPEADLTGARERLTLFLEQYWGGPSTYSQTRGHPRLRMRHAGFHIGPAARDAWLRHMRDAADSLGLPSAQHALLWDYLDRSAHSLLNTFDD